ncbi:MAG: bifunctional UDP-N-acetylglucosamine diphosphorylase/glucosamine-1-phosphate N-acetyltransferase GlmU [Actinomycetota bacterium]|nr:bifunctional UDP-N-acetylglucosamine diphosphorylase/glucosamine-1-phosphate N-acetyltransferase GlmU [Actinomycetota bacterium]
MRSRIPKVLHTLAGRSLLAHVLAATRGVDPAHLAVVVGHGREVVAPHLAEIDPHAQVVVQPEQLGTGHAARCALEALPPLRGTVLMTYGDTPLLTPRTLRELIDVHHDAGNAVTVLTARLPDPAGYGRILRDPTGAVSGIVEDRDADEVQRGVDEINSGIYVFDVGVLREALHRLRPDNVQGELYLTDVPALARADGHRVGAWPTADSWETEGVNDRVQLARLAAELNRRIVERHQRAGVTVVDPQSTWIDDTVTLESDTTLLPGVQLHGTTRVARDAVVGPDSTLTDVDVGEAAQVLRAHGSGASIGPRATVGPFAYLRPGTRLGPGAKIGAFVEAKNAVLEEAAKVPHLSYVGDAEVGAGTNIGAGTIFANYDGVTKHHTSVGAHCSTGANNTFVAPLEIGDGAATGAGTVVRRDVPPGALAVSAGPQRNHEQWTLRKRGGTAAAAAAEAAQQQAEETRP